ncbi:MAG: hypothetical protein KKF77_02890 [Proteobacteria bacterium]|nr:hypothetical protein [Pseudomonadota bacterium]
MQTYESKGVQDSHEFAALLLEKLPPVIAREKVEELTGGIVTGKTLANADAQKDPDKQGPEVAYRVGRKVVYSSASLVDWIVGRFPIRRIANLKTL